MLKKLKGNLETKEAGVIEGIASTDATDRHGEVVKQDGWDLKNFKDNPVLMLSHNYQEFPIGKVTDIKVVDGVLKFKAEFTKVTAVAREAFDLVKEGIMNCLSVGFVAKEYDEADRRIITKAELLEISLVSIPANQEAVITAKGMAKDNKLADSLVKHFLVENPEMIKKEIPTKVVLKKDNQINGEDGKKVDAEVLSRKLLQTTVGHLQVILSKTKPRKGGEQT